MLRNLNSHSLAELDDSEKSGGVSRILQPGLTKVIQRLEGELDECRTVASGSEKQARPNGAGEPGAKWR